MDTARETVLHKKQIFLANRGYTIDQLQKFLQKMDAAAEKIGESARFRVTIEVEGIHGNDEDGIFASRGDGKKGINLNHLFPLGVCPIGGRNQGYGELVMVQSYFEEEFSDSHPHALGVILELIHKRDIDEKLRKALSENKIHFIPYSQLPKWEGSSVDLVHNLSDIRKNLPHKTDYSAGGIVIEVINAKVREYVGSTSNYHRWKFIFKSVFEYKESTVEEIRWSLGKTGRVTPILQITPLTLSGMEIKSVNANSAAFVKENQLGKGAKIEVTRAGGIIPKVHKVIAPADVVNIIDACPCCGQSLTWEHPYLICVHTNCPNRLEIKLMHWAKTIQVYGMGPSTIRILEQNQCTTIQDVYALTEKSLVQMGFNPQKAQKLILALDTSKRMEIEDIRILGALGIPHLGLRNGRFLLSRYKLDELKNLTIEQVSAIPELDSKHAKEIIEGLKEKQDDLDFLLANHPNIEISQKDYLSDRLISGTFILFTGQFEKTRSELIEEAKRHGAHVFMSVNRRLDTLVCGKRASPSKINKAKKHGAEIIDAKEYVRRLHTKKA